MSEDQLSFDDLLIDEEEVNEALLTETLIDYVRIGDGSGDLVLQEAFEELTVPKKVTVVLLAQQALEGLEMAEDAWLTPTEIADRSGIKKGSIYPVVRDLDNDGIAQSNDGAYHIPTHNLETAKQLLSEEDSE